MPPSPRWRGQGSGSRLVLPLACTVGGGVSWSAHVPTLCAGGTDDTALQSRVGLSNEKERQSARHDVRVIWLALGSPCTRRTYSGQRGRACVCEDCRHVCARLAQCTCVRRVWTSLSSAFCIWQLWPVHVGVLGGWWFEIAFVKSDPQGRVLCANATRSVTIRASPRLTS